MSSRAWLRVASALSALFAVGHALGGLSTWSPMGDNPVLAAMRSTSFRVMGVDRTYADFYVGFGHSLTVTLVLQTVLLWQLGSLAGASPAAVQPMILTFVAANLAAAMIAWQFILPVPALFGLVLLLPLVLAHRSARP